MTRFERITQNFFQRFGILVRKYNAGTSESLRRVMLLQKCDVDMLLDVGANTGQYAQSIIDNGYRGRVVSFEPLTSAHKQLSNRASGNSNWTVAPRCAVGAANGNTTIHISENSVSSSLLNMLDSHLEGAQESKIIGTEEVPVRTLDSMTELFQPGSKNIFLKIDVQGYEKHVLQGAEKLFPNLRGLEIEMSIAPLYENQQWLFEHILNDMHAAGFQLMSLSPAFTDLNTGQQLQLNGIFMKP
jgi:FkbM family methyltransferase